MTQTRITRITRTLLAVLLAAALATLAVGPAAADGSWDRVTTCTTLKVC